MDVNYAVELIKELGFPICLGAGAIVYVMKTSSAREAKMWETITGFQSVLNKFDGTLKDVSLGLREVKSDIDTVKKDVADLKDSNRKE